MGASGDGRGEWSAGVELGGWCARSWQLPDAVLRCPQDSREGEKGRLLDGLGLSQSPKVTHGQQVRKKN